MKYVFKKSSFIFSNMLLITFSFGQTLEVNQDCSQGEDCESGICLELNSGSVCGTCSQSTYESLKSKKESLCSGFDARWKTSSAPEYLGSRASDGRVSRQAFETIAEKAKACRAARMAVTNTCFKNGERYDKFDHPGQIKQIDESITKTETTRATEIDNNNVYYCSMNTYESRLREFNTRCSGLNFAQINSDLEATLKLLEDDQEIDCDRIENYAEECEECYDAADYLFDDGFKGNSDLFPDIYNQPMIDAEATMKEAKSLVSMVNSESLCD